MTPGPRRVAPMVAYAWLILLVRASLALALGVVVLLTGELRPGMANVVAIYWILGSILTLRWASAHRATRGVRVATAAGIVGLVASAAVIGRAFLHGFLDEATWLALLGALSVLVGSLRFTGIFRESVTQDVRRSRPEAMILGALEIVLGLALVLGEEMKPIVIPMVGIWGLVGGSIMLGDALRARRVLRKG
jgi:hypothetical protein